MHGNVWEWVLDQFVPPSETPPKNLLVNPLVAPNTLYPRIVKEGPGMMVQRAIEVHRAWVLKRHGSSKTLKFPKAYGIILMLYLLVSEWFAPELYPV